LVSAVRHVFDTTLQDAVDEIIGQTIHTAIAKGTFSSIEEIQRQSISLLVK